MPDQRTHWSEAYTVNPDFFGEGPSDFAKLALERFREARVHDVLELGCGQGRDTFLFANAGMRVTALDYSPRAVEEVTGTAKRDGASLVVSAHVHDLRQPLPFPDGSFDACFSHMLLCMELSTDEIAFLLGEIRRVLRPGGLNLYSVRSRFDKHYRAGTHLREDICEVGGFVVHFFSEEKIRQLARGYDILAIDRAAEGSLPRDLYLVALQRSGNVVSRSSEEERMVRPMDRFEEFFDATHQSAVLDGKTKGLLFLTASLAGGCEL